MTAHPQAYVDLPPFSAIASSGQGGSKLNPLVVHYTTILMLECAVVSPVASFQSAVTRLPPELIDQCFSYLHYVYDDELDNRLNLVHENYFRKTLKACSLTCRTWAGVARRHLFRVWNVAFSTESRKYNTLQQVLTFLQDNHDVSMSVKWLRLRIVRRESSLLNIHRRSVRKQDCPADLLVEVLQALPWLVSLELDDVVLSSRSSGLTSTRTSAAPIALDSLDLIYDRRGEPEDVPTSELVHHILSLFNEVDTVRICDYMGNESDVESPDPSTLFSPSPRVRQFLMGNINGSATRALLSGLAASPSIHVLTHLFLGDVVWSHLVPLQSFLQVCAPTLTSLHLGLTLLVYENRGEQPVCITRRPHKLNGSVAQNIADVINLSCLHNLQSLGFSCIVDDAWFQVILLTIVAFLLPIRPHPRRNIPGLALRRLCFDVWAAFTIPLEQLRDSSFSQVLDQVISCFATLAAVDILFTTNLTIRDRLDDGAIVILQQMFSRLHARGILHITDVTVAESIDFLRRLL